MIAYTSRIAVLGLVVIYTIAPLAVLAASSLTSGGSRNLDRHLTLSWYAAVLRDGGIWQALQTSLVLALAVGITATCFGFLSARLMRRLGPKASLGLMLFLFIPALVPSLVSGFSLHAYFTKIHLDGTLLAMSLAQVLYTSPIAFILIHLAHGALDPDIEDCARNLGASEVTVTVNIVAPQVRHVCIGAGIICALISWDEFILAWFVGGFNRTLPVLVYGMLGSTIDPSLYAIGTLITLISVLLLFSAGYVMRTDFARVLVRK